MADLDITQAEANSLIKMEERGIDDKLYWFPEPGGKLTIPLTSSDKRENFVLDVTRAQIKVTNITDVRIEKGLFS